MSFYWFLHMCAFTIGFIAHISYEMSPWKTIICPWMSWKSLNLKMKFLYEPCLHPNHIEVLRKTPLKPLY